MSRRMPRGRLAWAIALLLIALLVVAERALHSRWSRSLYATGDAAWIWAPLAGVDGRPLAFFAARDFTLEGVPRSARLVAAADEGMRVALNGRLVAADAYAAGEPPGAWDLTAHLRPGRNRLVVTLTSARGIGAFIASLDIETADGALRHVRSGEEWSVFWRYRRALIDPDLDLDEGARPHVWGMPPVGRWPGSLSTRELPVVHRIAARRQVEARGVSVWTAGGWLEDPRAAAAGGEMLFDWGREVTGFLSLTSQSENPPLAAVYYGVGIPDPVRRGPGALVMTPAGGRFWQDPVPRTFRYALVVGTGGLSRAAVLAVDPVAAAPLLAESRRPRGVLGLEPPRLRTAIENEIWSELESLEGGRGREVR